MILIALGANLPSPVGPPAVTLKSALKRLADGEIEVVRCSRLYQTSPVPASDQPDFVNAVAELRTDMPPEDLLHRLHEVEAVFGRTRKDRWEARTLDLDLLAYHGTVTPKSPDKSCTSLKLPHPRLQERRFVLAPLAELAPDWVHPVLGRTAREMLSALAEGDVCEPLNAE